MREKTPNFVCSMVTVIFMVILLFYEIKAVGILSLVGRTYLFYLMNDNAGRLLIHCFYRIVFDLIYGSIIYRFNIWKFGSRYPI